MGNKGEANREAIVASMGATENEAKTDLIRDQDQLVRALSELKHLKAEQLETEDADVERQLKELNDRVKASIEAIKDADLESAQRLMARGYKESAFDPIDLHEMGFTDSEKEVLAAQMSS